MRPFFMTVGILAWLWAFAVMWIFAESGGVLTVIAAGVFGIVAVVSLACERILKLLEEIRDGAPRGRSVKVLTPQSERPAAMATARSPVTDPAVTLL